MLRPKELNPDYPFSNVDRAKVYLQQAREVVSIGKITQGARIAVFVDDLGIPTLASIGRDPNGVSRDRENVEMILDDLKKQRFTHLGLGMVRTEAQQAIEEFQPLSPFRRLEGNGVYWEECYRYLREKTEGGDPTPAFNILVAKTLGLYPVALYPSLPKREHLTQRGTEREPEQQMMERIIAELKELRTRDPHIDKARVRIIQSILAANPNARMAIFCPYARGVKGSHDFMDILEREYPGQVVNAHLTTLNYEQNLPEWEVFAEASSELDLNNTRFMVPNLPEYKGGKPSFDWIVQFPSNSKYEFDPRSLLLDI